jgi:hypothetical protein
MKASQLISPELDYWVAKAEGRKCKLGKVFGGPNDGKTACLVWVEPTELMHGYNVEYRPSSNWVHGGPILEHERVSVVSNGASWDAYVDAGYTGPDGQLDSKSPIIWEAPTYLIAAMRAYVASKFGEEVPDV